ncbi:MAG: DUF5319 domain-containing protein [Actinomycetota bacterium]|nr:DUF5319 domain-containing protein [Actinomycetota bacterium]
MEDEEEFYEEDAPLSDEEREALGQDLTDVDMLKDLLGPRGIKGAVFYCPDCDEDHYLTWDLLKGNLQELLAEGESPAHEPAFDPDPNEYVSWDYARGYLDGFENFEQEEFDELSRKLVGQLTELGLGALQVKAVLSAIGLATPTAEREPRR